MPPAPGEPSNPDRGRDPINFFGQHFRATFSGRITPPKNSAQRLNIARKSPPQNAPHFVHGVFLRARPKNQTYGKTLMFQFWGNFGAHFGARDSTLLKFSGQRFWATFSGRKFPPKSYAQKLRPKTPPSSGSKSIWGARERGEGEREVKGEGREGKGKRKGKREEDGEEEGDRI